MKIKDVVQQIIALKRKYNLVEKDATPKKEREWYTWALANGHIEFVEQDNKVIGFLEWARLNYIPENEFDIHIDHSIIKTAPILFVGNTIAEGKGILNLIKHSFLSKNKGWTYLVWHNKLRHSLKIFKNKEIAYGN
jgi:hypothetical protein